MKTTNKTDRRRNAALSKIHIAKKQIGLDDDSYRDLLMNTAGVKSSKDLTAAGLALVIKRLGQLGAKFTAPKQAGRRPHNLGSSAANSKQLGKIEALLAEAGRPWAYVEAMAKAMYKKDALAFCNGQELGGLITALMLDAKRHGRRVE